MSAAANVHHALAFARHGLAVVPIWWPAGRNGAGLVCACARDDCGKNAAKHPIGRLGKAGPLIAPNGINSATVETGIIKHWWSLAPEANIGVSTASLIVLDIDVRHDGLGSLAALEKQHGKLPMTWTVLTGSGGLHYYFRRPDGLALKLPIIATNIAKAGGTPPFGDGIDVPAYVIAPPSAHICGGFYQWEADGRPRDVELAAPPSWVLDRLAVSTAQSRTARTDEQWQTTFTGPIVEYRDAAATTVAGLALARIRDVRTAWHFLRAWNELAVQPPLSEQALWRIFDRICEKEREETAEWQ